MVMSHCCRTWSRVKMGIIQGRGNQVDMLAKYLLGSQISEISRLQGFNFEGGRSEIVE